MVSVRGFAPLRARHGAVRQAADGVVGLFLIVRVGRPALGRGVGGGRVRVRDVVGLAQDRRVGNGSSAWCRAKPSRDQSHEECE